MSQENHDAEHPSITEGLAACVAFLNETPSSLQRWPRSHVRNPDSTTQTYAERLQQEWSAQHREVRRAIETCLSPEERGELQLLKDKLLMSDATWKLSRMTVATRSSSAACRISNEEAEDPEEDNLEEPDDIPSHGSTSTSLTTATAATSHRPDSVMDWMVHFDKRLAAEWELFMFLVSEDAIKNLNDLNRLVVVS
eukprot:CAMPEP_0176423978 /NCGR_PEP_ID=MMETSP0127-20121128/10587_1 /TAXON_ID=938130 /ORGANISM="Platyophrya macrostoma, Strain WH" /LENGTH=195 /DNA_ID=CAMNT_0017804995 /DNA_START=81 /DNA_END=665 /DNA_ORIENTATION=+